MKGNLFGTSGVRGIVGLDLTPNLILNLGVALANLVGSSKVSTGFDTRVSSRMVLSCLVAGLMAGGARVLNHGLVPTPTLAYLTSNMNSKAGAMVTASHNPPCYNGVKMFDERGATFNHDLQMEIERLSKAPAYARWDSLGMVEEANYTRPYMEMVERAVNLRRRWRVIVDPGCGAACSIAPTVLNELGCEVIGINTQPDGFFPGRIPEPTVESLSILSEIVRNTGADVGVAYDGDADRMALVDERGEVLNMDRLIAAFASYIVSSGLGRVVVVPVDVSMCVEESVEAVGGSVVRSAVGDVNVAETVLRCNASFGAEASGAWIIPKHNLCPDGILSSVSVLEAVSEGAGETLSNFVTPIRTYHTMRAKVDCPNRLKEKIMSSLYTDLSSIMPEISEILTVDGIRVSSQSGWILVRPSGTEPVIRVTVEAQDPQIAKSLMHDTLTMIRHTISQIKNRLGDMPHEVVSKSRPSQNGIRLRDSI
ncbi:MAG: phosphoglucosamine mutase [Candidatus Bathyarchaeia archaeon]